MRLLGAACVALGGLWCGLSSARELRRRLAELDGLILMLERAAMELDRFRTPLPELFARLRGELTGPASALCGAAAEGLRAGEPFEDLWRRAAGRLSPPVRAVLLPLAAVLGRYGAEEQLAGLYAARDRLLRLRTERARALPDRVRVRVGVCTAGGLLLAVLLL